MHDQESNGCERDSGCVTWGVSSVAAMSVLLLILNDGYTVYMVVMENRGGELRHF